MLSLIVVIFESSPAEMVRFEIESHITYLRLAPGGTTPKRSKLALSDQGAVWSGGKLFICPIRDISRLEFLMYTSDEPLGEGKSCMMYAGCHIPRFYQYRGDGN